MDLIEDRVIAEITINVEGRRAERGEGRRVLCNHVDIQSVYPIPLIKSRGISLQEDLCPLYNTKNVCASVCVCVCVCVCLRQTDRHRER